MLCSMVHKILSYFYSVLQSKCSCTLFLLPQSIRFISAKSLASVAILSQHKLFVSVTWNSLRAFTNPPTSFFKENTTAVFPPSDADSLFPFPLFPFFSSFFPEFDLFSYTKIKNTIISDENRQKKFPP